MKLKLSPSIGLIGVDVQINLRWQQYRWQWEALNERSLVVIDSITYESTNDVTRVAKLSRL